LVVGGCGVWLGWGFGVCAGVFKRTAICQLSTRSCVTKSGVVINGSVASAKKQRHVSFVAACAATQPALSSVTPWYE
jgi:hypothetical protein